MARLQESMKRMQMQVQMSQIPDPLPALPSQPYMPMQVRPKPPLCTERLTDFGGLQHSSFPLYNPSTL